MIQVAIVRGRRIRELISASGLVILRGGLFIVAPGDCIAGNCCSERHSDRKGSNRDNVDDRQLHSRLQFIDASDGLRSAALRMTTMTTTRSLPPMPIHAAGYKYYRHQVPKTTTLEHMTSS